MISAPEEVRYKAHGAISALWRGPGKHAAARYSEVLIEGGAGTGKSFGTLIWLHTLAKEAPHGTRILWVRQSRRSMTESVLTTFEDKVLPMDTEWGRQILGRGKKDNRSGYDYPNCHVAIGTMEHPDRLYSTEWDIVWEEEATEIGFQSSLKFKRALRNNALPFQCHIRTCNPKSPYHWINRRFPQGHVKMPRALEDTTLLRLLTKHEDNPTLTARYLDELRSLPEPLRSQLYEGKWVAAEGLVWPQFQEDRHVVWSKLVQQGPRWFLSSDGHSTQGDTKFPLDRMPSDAEGEPTGERLTELRWFFASMDFGINAPGCLGVWGVDRDRRAYCVAEVYEPGLNPNEWADIVADLFSHYRFRALIADCADPGSISILNSRLSRTFGKGVGSIVRGSDKSRGVMHGIGVVRQSLHDGQLFWLPDDTRMVRGKNRELVNAGKPACSTEEILAYVYPSLEDLPEDRADKLAKEEKPDTRCADHGCDMVRYADVWLHGSAKPDHTPAPAKPKNIFPTKMHGLMEEC